MGTNTEIKLENVSFTRGKNKILYNVSLEVLREETFGLIGNSGSGKTTTLRLISGLSKPDEAEAEKGGTVTVQGENPHAWKPRQRKVATVWQDRALFPHLTVRGNIEFPLSVRSNVEFWPKTRRRSSSKRKQDVERIAEKLRLTRLLDQRCTSDKLSGGEQQRVALARALVIKPEILLLDEPFTGLDQGLKLELQADFRELMKETECTVVLVSHQPDEVFSLSDRVAILEGGSVVQIGKWDDLYQKPGNLSVARFVGYNVIPATVRRVDGNDGTVQVDVTSHRRLTARAGLKLNENDPVWYAIAPGDITVMGNGKNIVSAEFRRKEKNGFSETLYFELKVGDTAWELKALRVVGQPEPPHGAVQLSWDTTKALVIKKKEDSRASAATPP
jgi:ABC-type Fe3+/spermidine/putrescine transport system ATPase subunit